MEAEAVTLMWWAVAAWALAKARRAKSVQTDIGDGWVWPVPSAIRPGTDVQYDATVSSGFESERRIKSGPRKGQKRPHVGLDIMYRRKARADDGYPPGERGADGMTTTKGYILPENTPAIAARAGLVWSVKERTDGGGWSVVLDHGSVNGVPLTTYYTHLRMAAVRKGQTVAAGDELGTIAGNMADSGRVRHLHFQLMDWSTGKGVSVDVWQGGRGVMATWQRRVWRPATW